MNEDIFHLGIKALITNNQGKILLLKVNPEELKKHQGEPYWDIPGGRVHRGASVEETLRREVEEETGQTIKSSVPFFMALSPLRIPIGENSDVGLILSVYLCEVREPNTIRLSKEHLEFGWFDKSQVSELLAVKYPKEFIEKIPLL